MVLVDRQLVRMPEQADRVVGLAGDQAAFAQQDMDDHPIVFLGAQRFQLFGRRRMIFR